MLLIAASVHAQSIADIARKERERQSKAKSTRVIKPDEVKSSDAAQAKPADAKPAGSEAAKEPAKLQEPTKVDPVQVWNNQLEQFRTKIRAFQDQETSLQLQLNQATNQFYAPVIDPATQQAAQAKVAQIQQQLADVRKGMDDAKKDMDALQLQGPPKK
jgi:vacuolar-type H+-ATPase subunit I/STV1